MNKKILTLAFVMLFILVSTSVLSQPPFQEPTQGEVPHLDIALPKNEVFEQGDDIELHFHVYNSSGFEVSNRSKFGMIADCEIHIWGTKNEHLIVANLTIDINQVDYVIDVNTGNISNIGTYSYVTFCNATNNEAGFVSTSFNIRANIDEDTSDINYIIWALIAITIYFGVMGSFFHNFGVKILLYGISLVEVLMLSYIIHLNRLTIGLAPILDIHFKVMLILSFLIGMTAMIVFMLKLINPGDELERTENKPKWL